MGTEMAKAKPPPRFKVILAHLNSLRADRGMFVAVMKQILLPGFSLRILP